MLPRFTPKSLSLSPDLKYFQNGPFLGSSLIGLLMSKIKFYWGGRGTSDHHFKDTDAE